MLYYHEVVQKIQSKVYMTVVNYPAKLVFFQFQLIFFFNIIFKLFVKLDCELNLCQLHLNIYKISIQKNVEKLNSRNA